MQACSLRKISKQNGSVDEATMKIWGLISEQ